MRTFLGVPNIKLFRHIGCFRHWHSEIRESRVKAITLIRTDHIEQHPPRMQEIATRMSLAADSQGTRKEDTLRRNYQQGDNHAKDSRQVPVRCSSL